MNYGLYLSASGVLTSMHRQDVVANNLANVNTVGFKPDDVTLMSRLPERLEGGAFGMLSGEPADPQWLLERLGGGQFIAPSRVDLRQGVLQRTGNDLDLAIEGEGFFVVNSGPNGGANADGSMRLTRDGRFTLNHAGELVMAATGHRVLDANDQPIVLERNEPVRIDSAGQISQHGEIVATVQIASVSDKSALTKEGDNLLRFVDSASGTLATRRSANGAVKQHYIENSAVDPVMALNDLIAASRAVQANATMMQHHNTILGEAINTFGRVA